MYFTKDIPTEAGTYYMMCEENDYEEERVYVYLDEDNNLRVIHEGIKGNYLHVFHENLTEVRWARILPDRGKCIHPFRKRSRILNC